MPVPDFSPGEVLTAAAMDSIGLWKVTTATATSGGFLSIANCFTADYDAYRVVITDARASGATVVEVRFIDGGGVISSNYAWVYVNSSYATTSTYNQQGTTGSASLSVLGGVADPAGGGTAFDVFNPFSSANKTVVVGSRTDPRTGGAAGAYNGFHNVAQTVTGIYFSLGAGTITNLTATIYGYRK
jgi:hypothetical protein